jgi:hypothetical protein
MVVEMIYFELWRQNGRRVGTRGNVLQVLVAGQMGVLKQKEICTYHFVSLPHGGEFARAGVELP